MNIFKITRLLLVGAALILLTNCASGYKLINPEQISYKSSHESEGVTLQYKYDLLDKKYAKKEVKNDIKLVAIKIINNTNQDLTFGNDIKLTYESGSQVMVMENEKVFKDLKQSPASYLFYLLLSPLNFYTSTTTNGYTEETSSFPAGLIIGPGLAGGNFIAASSANKKFETELLTYDINGTVIPKGETRYGLIGINSDSFDALKIKLD